MKQRSKAELLKNIRCFEAMKKDEEKGTDYRGNVSFWRNSVLWGRYLLYNEKFTKTDLRRFYANIGQYDILDFPDAEKKRINAQLVDMGSDYVLINKTNKSNRKDHINKVVDNMVNYNTEMSTNFGLIACDWLIKNKKFTGKQLERAICWVYICDNYPQTDIEAFRNDLYKKKDIWIALSDNEQPEDNKEVV